MNEKVFLFDRIIFGLFFWGLWYYLIYFLVFVDDSIFYGFNGDWIFNDFKNIGVFIWSRVNMIGKFGKVISF